MTEKVALGVGNIPKALNARILAYADDHGVTKATATRLLLTAALDAYDARRRPRRPGGAL